MKIAICDDSDQDADKLRALIEEYPSKNLEITTYSSAVALLADYSSGARHDLLFLDILMEGMNGFTAAERLHNDYRDEMPKIVFVTVTDLYALHGYNVEAIAYLIKPVDKESVLSKIGQVYNNLKDVMFELHIEGETEIVRAKNVIYVSSENNNVVLHTKNGFFSVRKTLNELLSELPKCTFFQTHRCYIVNLAYVKDYRWHYAYLKDCRIEKV